MSQIQSEIIQDAANFPPPSPLPLSIVTLITRAIVFSLWLTWRAANYVFVALPQKLLALLQRRFLVTLLLLLVVLFVVLTLAIAYLLVRQRLLAKYSAETTPKAEKIAYSLGLDYVTGAKKKRGTDRLTNYLDEFLSAIKVFGYLERPVFHELTRNMTTQKLVDDEILCLDESVGFSIVVEGTIQVYAKIDEGGGAVDVERDDEDYEKDEILVVGSQKYQLLNEVKSGSPLSSLLSTLNLFRRPHVLLSSPTFQSLSELSKLDLAIDPKDPQLMSPTFNAALPDSNVSTPGRLGTPVSTMGAAAEMPEIIARPKPSRHSGVSATVAIIPSVAFQRVHSKFPKALSHIVTMVLARLYKVTLSTVHNYLGLTKEIVDTEIALNRITDECKLPSYLHDTVLEYFENQKPEAEVSEPISLMTSIPKSTRKARKLHRENSSKYIILASRSKASHPGDLLSAVPLSRRPDFSHTHSLAGELFVDKKETRTSSSLSGRAPEMRDRSFSGEREETEESSLRIAIVENLFKLLGIEESLSAFETPGLHASLPSVGSWALGLSSLMPDSSTPVSFERYFYDSIADSRMSSVSVNAGFSPRSQKLYTTFHAKTAKTDKGTAPEPPRSEPKKAPTVEIAAVKSAFSKNIEVKYYAPGATLVLQNSFDTGLFYVIHGGLDVSTAQKERSRKLYSVGPGGLAGYLSTIVGFRSLVSVKLSKDGVIVAYVSKEAFLNLMDKYYFLQLPVAAKLKALLPSIIQTIDFALEWCHIPAGGVLASQGDLANGFHIVLSGRFRVVRNKKTAKPTLQDEKFNLVDDSNSHTKEGEDFEILGEYGHGQSIGEVEVLTASRRTNSLIAVRDSETARIPRSLFEMLSLQNPAIMVKVSRIVANRVLESNDRDQIPHKIATSTTPRSAEREYKTITILPSVGGLPVREFADRLVSALRAIGRNVIALDRASTLNHLGRHAFDERLAHLKLSGYFAYLEEKYETIVYVCDTPLKSNWTATCISQGDCILLLADAEDDECATSIGDYEKLLVKLKTTARTDLCLIHPEKSVMPGSTSIWLKNRIWVQGHHHIQMEFPRDSAVKHVKKKNNILFDLAVKIGSKANPNIKLKLENVRSKALASWMKLNERINKREEVPVQYKNDFLRLARILLNEAVGLVLGGGGSRGISHVGVVTALEKHGIPVDIVGGTSIGSFVGGLYAKESNIVLIYGMSKKFATRVGSIWRNIFDLTYPVTSYITGYEFNRGIWKVFGYHEIEDFWIKYFCNSTNITNSEMEIHESGYAWRFIRASMSLAGLLPPIAYNGCMLLDGGYLDNLPVMEMKNRGAKYIFAVDVGSVDDRTPMNYGDSLSGFWVIMNRFNPFSKHPNVPNMMDIQLRLAYVASVYALELAKKTPGVIYLRPPIDDYATLDFLKFDEIYNVGLAYADEILTRWEDQGKFPKIAGMGKSTADAKDRKAVYRRNSI